MGRVWWDVALTQTGRGDGLTLRLALPVELGRAVLAKGMDRATIEGRDDGLLVRPHRSGGETHSTQAAVVLPEAWGRTDGA